MTPAPTWFRPGQHDIVTEGEVAFALDTPCPVCYGGGALVGHATTSVGSVLLCDDCGTAFYSPSELLSGPPYKPFPYRQLAGFASLKQLEADGWDVSHFFQLPGR